MKNHRTIDWLSFYYLPIYVNKRMNDVFRFTFIYTSCLHLQHSIVYILHVHYAKLYCILLIVYIYNYSLYCLEA